jgi:hypothetical protein
MATKIYPSGSKTITVAAGEKLAVSSFNSTTEIYQKVGYPNVPDTWDLLTTVLNTEYLSGAFSSATEVRIDAGIDGCLYDTGAAPQVSSPVSDITGTDDPLNITGESAAQGGVVNVKGGTSSTSANAGGAANLTGGIAGATGVGGAANVTAGAGGSTSGNGGVSSMTGGAGTAGNATGGVSKVVGGAGQGSGSGGASQVTGGAGGATGTGGASAVTGGAGGATSGAGGAASITGGTASAGNSAGGAASLAGGAGSGTGNGGNVSITAGASGAGATGNGGDVNVTAGAASSTDGNGGTVSVVPTVGAGSGIAGMVKLGIATGTAAWGFGCARSTIADAGTLTDAQHRSMVIYQDASGGVVTCTTRTGTQLAAAFPDMSVGDAVPLYHASNHATNTSTVSGGADVTLVGSGAVVNTGGQYLMIKTAATTFDLVRVG